MKTYIIKKAADRKIKESILLVSEIKETMLKDDIVKKILKEFKLDEDIVEGFSIIFDEDLDVTAKTINGEVSLNKDLMSKSFDTIMRYVIHEFVHVCQHIKNQKSKAKKSDKDHGYLENEEEIEAFKWQVLFDSEENGKKSVHEYLEELMDFHDFPDSKREDKIEELKGYLE